MSKRDVAWLQSDSQIIGRAQKSPEAQGTLWQIELPDGETFGAILEKADAASVSMFCNMVRDEWNEREEESEAKARRKAALDDVEHPRAGGKKEDVSPLKEDVARESFSETLHRQLREAQAELNDAQKRARELAHQVKALSAAVEALDAPEDVREEPRDIEVQVEGRDSQAVGDGSR